MKLFPSLISADVLNLQKTVEYLEPYSDGFHLDVMDFHFVPNITMGSGFVNEIAKISKKTLWVHLMIDRNEQFLDQLRLRPADIVSFHFESIKDCKKFIADLQKQKLVPSMAIKPKTAINELLTWLPHVPHVLLMSVEPGFSGQQFLQESVHRLKELVNLRKEHNLNFVIGMDGGINASNINQLSQLGAEDFAVASAIFNQSDPITALQILRKQV